MKIISFAWTTNALLAGSKTVTRRDWDDRYARKFKAGDICAAWDKSPRSGGKKVGEIRLTRDPYKQWLHEVTDTDERLEGGLWGSGRAYREMMGGDREVWVIEFELSRTCLDKIMESTEHHRLKQVALRWLRRNGCVAFACEVSWGWSGIVDAVGMKSNGTVYLVEAKVSNSDMEADYKRNKHKKRHIANNYDFLYYIVSGVDMRLIDNETGILDTHGRVQRKAKRNRRTQNLQQKCKEFRMIAAVCSWRAYGHVIRGEKEQMEFCV